jgi:hypothetical protein
MQRRLQSVAYVNMKAERTGQPGDVPRSGLLGPKSLGSSVVLLSTSMSLSYLFSFSILFLLFYSVPFLSVLTPLLNS